MRATIQPTVWQDLKSMPEVAEHSPWNDWSMKQIEEVDYREMMLEQYARSIWMDGTVIAVVGIWPQHPGVSRAWTQLSRVGLDLYPKALHQATLECIELGFETFRLWRIEAHCRFGHEEGRRWLRHLGFMPEALMKNYGFGGHPDYWLYARTRQWPL